MSAGKFAEKTQIPSVWFYGDNDSYFNVETYRAMYEQYVAAGGNAKLIAFGVFGNDSHSMFGSRDGEPIWQPEVSKLLMSVGLPYELLNAVKSRTSAVPAAIPIQ